MSEANPTHPGSATDDLSRRDFFSRTSDGVFGAGLAYLLAGDFLRPPQLSAATAVRTHDLTERAPHFNPRARAVIQLFMTGGPSQVDLLDPKPVLKQHAGELPRAFLDNVESVGMAGGLLPSPFKFRNCGDSGIPFSEILPHTSRHADDIAVVRSMWTTVFNHGPAVFRMHTGQTTPVNPTMGAWVAYGLGTANQNLPAYVALDDPQKEVICGIRNWQSGWLPPVYQGTRLRSIGSPLVNLHAKNEFPAPVLEVSRELLRRLNTEHQLQRPGQPDLNARIASYDLAARMQLSATHALDLNQETSNTRKLYGVDNSTTGPYARRCLMARRLVERGVRFVQVFMNCSTSPNPWDHHGNIKHSLKTSCGETDQPVGALLTDLKQRGLLDSTLVIWGGEFGRLPIAQLGGSAGRDHGANGFSIWLAGGGIKGGMTHGATDDFGYHAIKDRVSVHDFHATVLHLLGIDHQRLVYPHHGLDEKLTGVEPARILEEIIA